VQHRDLAGEKMVPDTAAQALMLVTV